MKKIFLFLSILVVSSSLSVVNAQLLVEDFSSLTVGNLGTQNSWVQNGSGTDVQVVSTDPITYGGTGYPSGGGNHITISTVNGVDPHKTFTAQSTASSFTIFYSFLINVTSAPTTTGDYFLSLRNSANTTYGGRVFAKQGSSSSKFQIGVSKGSASADNYSSDLDVNSTYLVVVKYISNSGTANDEMYCWIYSDQALPESAPANNTASVSHNSSNADPSWGSEVNSIMIHQRSATNTIAAKIDGIRVATSWSQAPLPVELTSFTASSVNGSVNLNWATATEVSNYGFEVERSADKSVWNKIGFVAGNGNSNSVKSYSYSDNTASAGTVYYRLKQLDTDGKYEYSKVVSVNNTTPDAFTVDQNFPNPFNPSTTIRFSLSNSSNVKVDVYAPNGELVHTLANQTYEAGNHAINFDASQLSAGIYLYRITAIDAAGMSFSAVKKMQLIK